MPISLSLHQIANILAQKVEGRFDITLGPPDDPYTVHIVYKLCDDENSLSLPTLGDNDGDVIVSEETLESIFYEWGYSSLISTGKPYLVVCAYYSDGVYDWINEDTALVIPLLSSSVEERKGFVYSSTGDPINAGLIVFVDGPITIGEFVLTLTNLENYTLYYIRAFTINLDGTIVYGDLETFKSRLPFPQTIMATPKEEANRIDFSLVENAEGYNLYWATNPGVTINSNKFEDIGSPFTHSGLVAGQRYYYRVTAFTSDDESELSYEVMGRASEGFYIPPDFSPHNWRETEEYIRLLTSQYQLAEKFKEWLRKNIEILKGVADTARDLNNAFDIDFAKGIQLDIIGEIVGIGRVLPFEPSDGSDPILSDYIYKQLIKATIARNHWDGKIESIEKAWRDIFPNSMILIQDNQDMSLNVSVLGDISELLQDLISADMIIPRPQAVLINYEWSPKPTKIFAYDLDSEDYGGYDVGRWSTEILE